MQRTTFPATSRAWRFLRAHRVTIALVVVIRLAFAVDRGFLQPERYRSQIIKDQVGYSLLAGELAASGTYSIRQLDAIRPPGYPFFLALCGVIPGHLYIPAVLIQILLDAVNALLVILIARSVPGMKGSAACGVLYALDPRVVKVSTLLMSDTLFLLFVLLALRAAFTALERHRAGEDRSAAAHAALSGILLGTSTLIRVSGTMIFAVVLAWYVARGLPVKGRVLRHAFHALLLAAAFGVCIAPWMQRNSDRYGSLQLTFTSGFYLTELMAQYVRDEESIYAAARSRCAAERGDSAWLHPRWRDVYLRRAAVEAIAADPVRSVREFAAGLARRMRRGEYRDFPSRIPFLATGVTILSKGYVVLAGILFAGSLILSARYRRTDYWLLSGLMGVTVLASGFAMGDARLLHPLIPFITINTVYLLRNAASIGGKMLRGAGFVPTGKR